MPIEKVPNSAVAWSASGVARLRPDQNEKPMKVSEAASAPADAPFDHQVVAAAAGGVAGVGGLQAGMAVLFGHVRSPPPMFGCVLGGAQITPPGPAGAKRPSRGRYFRPAGLVRRPGRAVIPR